MEYKIGHKCGLLTIIDIYRNKKNRTEIKCLCDCGNEHITLLSYFKIGRVRNCDRCGRIHQKENIKKFYKNQPYTKHHNFKGYGEIPLSFFNSIKMNAERRNIVFDITIEYLYELYIQQNKKCYFTDIDIFLNKKDCNASVDRIDSNIGYKIDNIIWVYKPINNMKNDFEIKRFIEICCLISDNKRFV